METRKNKLSAKRIFVFKNVKAAGTNGGLAQTDPTNTMVTLTVTGKL